MQLLVQDMMLGKHTDVLESKGARDAIEEHCVSIFSGNKVALHYHLCNVSPIDSLWFSPVLGLGSQEHQSFEFLAFWHQFNADWDREKDLGSG